MNKYDGKNVEVVITMGESTVSLHIKVEKIEVSKFMLNPTY